MDRFELLYRAHFAYVRHVVRCAGVREADVADVVQEVFVIVHRELQRGGLDTSSSLLGWLKRTAFRRARDERELVRNREEPHRDSGVIELADRGPGAEERMQAIDTTETVLAVLDTLPHEQRLVLVMSDIEEMPMREIAEVLEIPEGTGYSRLRAARASFTRTWTERRASGHAAILPFALWDAGSLLKAGSAIPHAPQGFEDEVWRRITEGIARGAVGAGVAGGAAVATAKAGLVITGKQAVIGALLSAIAGAGIYAAVRTGAERPAGPVAALSADMAAHRGVAAPASSASAEAAPTSAPTASGVGTAASSAAAPTQSTEANERLLLDAARAALERGDLAMARSALARIKSPRFAAERDELRRLVNAYQDGGR